jgi:hypothetical protein
MSLITYILSGKQEECRGRSYQRDLSECQRGSMVSRLRPRARTSVHQAPSQYPLRRPDDSYRDWGIPQSRRKKPRTCGIVASNRNTDRWNRGCLRAQRRAAASDVVGAAIRAAKVATGKIEEDLERPAGQQPGKPKPQAIPRGDARSRMKRGLSRSRHRRSRLRQSVMRRQRCMRRTVAADCPDCSSIFNQPRLCGGLTL